MLCPHLTKCSFVHLSHVCHHIMLSLESTSVNNETYIILKYMYKITLYIVMIKVGSVDIYIAYKIYNGMRCEKYKFPEYIGFKCLNVLRPILKMSFALHCHTLEISRYDSKKLLCIKICDS